MTTDARLIHNSSKGRIGAIRVSFTPQAHCSCPTFTELESLMFASLDGKTKGQAVRILEVFMASDRAEEMIEFYVERGDFTLVAGASSLSGPYLRCARNYQLAASLVCAKGSQDDVD